MDKSITKMLDQMTGKEVWQFVENLEKECDLFAVDEFFQTYYPHMCAQDINRSIDFVNEQTRYLINEKRRYKKLILEHKLELIRRQKFTFILIYQELLKNLIYSRIEQSESEKETLEEIGNREIRMDNWSIKPNFSWHEMIAKMESLLSNYNKESLQQTVGPAITQCLEKTREAMQSEEYLSSWLQNWESKNEKEEFSSVSKEQLREVQEWFETP